MKRKLVPFRSPMGDVETNHLSLKLIETINILILLLPEHGPFSVRKSTMKY